jgi:hypothetical protein
MAKAELVDIFHCEVHMNFGKIAREKARGLFLSLYQLSIYSRAVYPICVIFIF